MKRLLLLVTVGAMLSCQKEEKATIETMEVKIDCERAFPVSVDGVDKGHCGTRLIVQVVNGAVIKIVPDIVEPSGETSEGVAEIRYNNRTTTRHVTGDGALVKIEW